MNKIYQRSFGVVVGVVVATCLLGVAASMAQEVDLSQSKAAAKSKPIKVSPHNLGFGSATAPKVKTTTVTNPGTRPVDISIAAPAVPFSLQGSASFTVSPKRSQVISVRAPASQGQVPWLVISER